MVDGQRLSQTVDRLSDAERVLQEWESRRKKGLTPSLERSLRSYLEDFLALLEAGGGRTTNGQDYKPRSRTAYVESLRIVLARRYPEFDKSVDAISRRDMQRVADDLGIGVKRATLSARLAPVHRVWSQVSLDNEIRNPMHKLTLKKDEQQSGKATPAPDEAYMLSLTLGPRERMATMFCLFLGLRINEALALKWEHVDLQQRRVHVQHGWSEGTYTTPKTRQGVRLLAYSDVLDNEVATYRAWLEAQVDAARFLEPTALVISHPNDSHQREDPRTLYKRIDRKVGAKAGQLLRGHALRRAMTTQLFRSETPLNIAQQTLGHATPTTTLQHYAAVQERDLDVAADRMNASVGRVLSLVEMPDAEIEAWVFWQEILDYENQYLEQSAEVNGGGFAPRDAPLFDF
jgi:integrase